MPRRRSVCPWRRSTAALPPIDKHDVCNMQYTSGTTGFPKGVMLTHYNVVNNGKAIGDCMDLSTADQMMIQVPMFHCFGMVLAMTAAMTHGTTMCPIPCLQPQEGPGLHQPGADHLLPRGAHHVYRHAGASGLRQDGFQPHAHRHHGGQPLPDQGDAGSRGEDAHARDLSSPTARPRPVPGCTMSKTTDSIEARVNTVGARHVRRGMQDRGPGNRRGSARTMWTANSWPGATIS